MKDFSIESFLKTVLIADFEAHREEMMSTYFCPKERSVWTNKPARSIAGRIALKSAVCALAQKHFSAKTWSPHDVEIETDPNGAPGVAANSVSDPAFCAALTTEIFVSISHSKTSAAGLAVLATRSAS
jgi:phosphopantetheinyl transferase (holo-ACP synthase)